MEGLPFTSADKPGTLEKKTVFYKKVSTTVCPMIGADIRIKCSWASCDHRKNVWIKVSAPAGTEYVKLKHCNVTGYNQKGWVKLAGPVKVAMKGKRGIVGYSLWDPSVVYKVGKETYPISNELNPAIMCGDGIHVYERRKV